MGKNQEYASQYAEYAMEQMRRYGIPASVTLAQAILESSNGQSRLAVNENNHFGIKATPSWIANGGEYGLYTDDKPNEKFCRYASVGDSYEHHSQFLKENSRYAQCFTLAPDDYRGWTTAIADAGYASASSDYASRLQSIIESNDLQQYDQIVMREMQAQGREFGVDANPRDSQQETVMGYSFPLQREEFLFITSPFGMRQDPMDATKQQMHKGIDIRTNHEAVLATEDSGKVVAVNQNTNTAGGKSVTVEYTRDDGSRVQCSYLHLDSIDVKVGDEVNAGQQLGISGNTGTRTTGEHLHFGVKNISADGTSRDVDPAAYLAEIAQKGNIPLQALHNGDDLLAKYKTQDTTSQAMAATETTETSLSPDEWMKKLLSSEDSGVSMSTGDPIVEMAMTAFTSLLALAMQIDNKSEEEQKAAVSTAVDKRTVDLSPLVPGMKDCVLVMSNDGKAILQANNGSVQVNRELSSAELNRLSATLGNENLTDEVKQLRVAGLINGIVLSEQASQNFEQGMAASQGQQETIKR